MRTIGGMVLGAALTLAYSTLAAPSKEDSAPERPEKKPDPRVFELRTYTAAPGKMDALHARFRDHTLRLFEKNGITSIGYWSPTDPAAAKKKLIYIIAFPSLEAAKKNTDAFINDPEWKEAFAESEKKGKLVSKVESVYLKATDFSPIQ